ncbi:unnamed protein product [Trichogramma brassicae]|uniref:Uncharacterized protein n=1 Tax=Trichogramma brassicae TaxID=86971 RepID=A0A6H5INW2_9HYME|nr:unnamed protein product [Trichogramma brassicae]
MSDAHKKRDAYFVSTQNKAGAAITAIGIAWDSEVKKARGIRTFIVERLNFLIHWVSYTAAKNRGRKKRAFSAATSHTHAAVPVYMLKISMETGFHRSSAASSSHIHGGARVYVYAC